MSLALLNNADLQNTLLTGAILLSADLRGADLRGSNLSNADLRSADLRGARWDCANVENARFGCNVGLSKDMKSVLEQQGAIFEQFPRKAKGRR